MKVGKALAPAESNGPSHRRNLSYAKEIKAIIKRVDDLFGGKNWQSVGNYFESIIRNQLADWIPQRYSIDTGFVVSLENNQVQRSKQIDIIIWDSQNFHPVFRDRSFVLVQPPSLRVAIEVKRTLDARSLRLGLENLDSLNQFIPINAKYFSHLNAQDRPHFRRYLVAGQSRLKFPDEILNGLYKYYQSHETGCGDAWTIKRRIKETRLGMSPWISGAVVLGKGMVQAVRHPPSGKFNGYLVANDAGTQGDLSISELKHNLHDFLVRGSVDHKSQDAAHFFGEKKLQIMPVPFSRARSTGTGDQEIYKPPDNILNWRPSVQENARRKQIKAKIKTLKAELSQLEKLSGQEKGGKKTGKRRTTKEALTN